MRKNENQKTIIVIPSFNGWFFLKICLESLEKQIYKNFKIVVIDDASTDKTKQNLKKYFPQVDVLILEKNSGFVKSINEGIKYALKEYQPDYLAILNNDVEADQNWLKYLIERAQSRKKIAAVTSNMFFLKKPNVINSQGGTIDWNGDGHDINFNKLESETKTKSRLVLGACFGGTLIKTEYFEKIGWLDKRYHAYYEDLDWSWRANILGYEIYFEKKAILRHFGSRTYQNNLLKKIYLCKRNALTSAIKNYEFKNLGKRILYILIGYWFLILDYLVFPKNIKKSEKQKMSFTQRLGFILIPFKSIFWNLVHIPQTIILRKEIQKNRKIDDQKIFQLINQDETSIHQYLSSFSNYSKKPIKFGINVLGYFDAESGVGEAARSIVRALQLIKIPLALNNEMTSPSQRRDNEFSRFFIKQNPYFINIIAIYGDTFKSVIDRRGKYLKNKYNIAYWAWELSEFPKKWIKHLKHIDEIWVPSNFVRNSIKKYFKKPISVIPHSIEIKENKIKKNKFLFNKESFIFLFIFDFYSYFERKNPLTIIQSFKKAFRRNEKVELVIKCSNAEIDKNNFEELRKQAENWPIKIINQYMSRTEINGLINLSDAYISLHRSEGFGLTIAEAMALGKPVIATNYSGNTDFMNAKNSFPVNYVLKKIRKDFGPYKKNNIWAEADINQAAGYMRNIFENKKMADEIGNRAKKDISINFSPNAISQKIEKRLDQIRNNYVDK